MPLYGGVKQAALCRDPEVVLVGPAECGKTFGLLHRLHRVAVEYRKASLVIMRKTLTSTYSTVIPMFREKILEKCDPGGQVKAYGGEKPQWFDYPNESRIWVSGMDKTSKILSAEHDMILVVQAEELSLGEWETLTTRVTGRAGHVRYPQLCGDLNPSHPMHWLLKRRDEGSLTMIESTHRDNPVLYDPETGELTEQGERTLTVLDNLTGSRKMRLRYGIWAAPAGAIFDVFDEETHKVKSFPIPPLWPRVVGADPFGAEIAAVWTAFDMENLILHVYREYSRPFGVTTAEHARNLLQLSHNETIFAWVGGGPSERAWRLEFNAAGIPLLEPGTSDVWIGIDKVYGLMKDHRLVVHDSCPGLLSEIGGYSRKVGSDGVPTDKIEKKERFHLIDSLRYACVWLTKGQQTEVVYNPVQIGGRW